MCRVWLPMLALCFATWMLFIQQRKSDYLSGTVVSEAGTPIEGVKIFAWRDTTTDPEGRFKLPTIPRKNSVVYFQKESFRPRTLVVPAGTRTLKVVLEDDKKTAWFLSACLPGDDEAVPGGAKMEFLLPKKAKVRQTTDIDYRAFVVTLEEHSKPLQIWYGPLVSPGSLTEQLILRSASFQERSIHNKSGQLIGNDLRGKAQDGFFWRAADFPGFHESVIYDGASPETARAYDRIIDSACQPEQSP